MHRRASGDGCTGWADTSDRPASVVCPPQLEYPEPPDPVRLLFVSWNPPGSLHFWNSNSDRLRRHLGWVFGELGWIEGADFLAAFARRGAFLVHAVRCWQHRDGPPKEAVERCARATLLADLVQMRPERLCLLGSVPHEAALKIVEGLPPVIVSYFDGWSGEATIPTPNGPLRVPTLVTVLPDQWNRRHTLRTLGSWWSVC